MIRFLFLPHGFSTFARSRLMRSNFSTTDGIYGVLSSADVGKRISNLGKKMERGDINREELLRQITEILKK
jgi:hypothetical protein